MKAIQQRMPSRREKEENREALKDYMENLLENPPNNSILQILETNRARFPTSMFELLIELTISDCLELVASQIDHDVLRKMRQGFGENLLTFNNRFYTKMLEVYPDNGRKLSEEVGNQNTTFNSTELRERSQIYNCYMAAIRKDIADKIPYIEGTGKCLKFAMNKAIGIEINMKDVQALRRNEGQYGKRSSRRFVKTYEVRKEENSSLICYNCNVKGHIIKNCSRPLTTCKYCNKKGHLLKHCRGKKFQNNSRSSYGGWKQNLTNIAIITTLAAICASVGAEETAEPREKWYKPPFVGDFMIQAVYTICQTKYYIPMIHHNEYLYTVQNTVEML
uniref:CCHC-type domain-containing protein n=1 Tax=Strongyloides papillosus TaxID=174720 RepID=A0A0N5BBQ6_STREA